MHWLLLTNNFISEEDKLLWSHYDGSRVWDNDYEYDNIIID